MCTKTFELVLKSRSVLELNSRTFELVLNCNGAKTEKCTGVFEPCACAKIEKCTTFLCL